MATADGNGTNGDRNARRKAIAAAANVLLHLVAEEMGSSHVRVHLALDGVDVRREFTLLDKDKLQ